MTTEKEDIDDDSVLVRYLFKWLVFHLRFLGTALIKVISRVCFEGMLDGGFHEACR